MNKQYDNTNRGALFKNTRKEKETHPDYNGSINVGGVEYWLSAWLKEGQKGRFFSMSVQPKEPKPDAAPEGVNNPTDLDDEIPF